MRTLVLSLFFCLCLSHYCQKPWQFISKKYECPLTAKPIENFSELLKKSEFQGQPQALEIIEGNLRANLHGNTRQAPLVLHFSGPTGVGKTHIAKLLGGALFEKKDGGEVCGLLQLKASAALKYVNDEEFSKAVEEFLVQPIVTQLKHCPRSLILVDDIQHLKVTFLDALSGAFQAPASLVCSSGPYKNDPVSTADAIFILTSDFETSDQITLTADLTEQETFKIIKELAEEKWGSFARGSMLLNVIPLVPFNRLSLFQLRNILKIKLRHLEREIGRSMKAKHVRWDGSLKYTPGFEEDLLNGVLDPSFGAREIDDFFRTYATPAKPSLISDLTPLAVKSIFPSQLMENLGIPSSYTDADVQVKLVNKQMKFTVLSSRTSKPEREL